MNQQVFLTHHAGGVKLIHTVKAGLKAPDGNTVGGGDSAWGTDIALCGAQRRSRAALEDEIDADPSTHLYRCAECEGQKAGGWLR